MKLWSKTHARCTVAAVSFGTMSAAPLANAATVPGEIVAVEGSVPTGAAVAITNVRQPFVNAAGQVSFVGTLANGDRFVFVEDQVVWVDSDEATVLTSVQPHIATFDGDAFVLSASSAGMAVLWSNTGALVLENDPAPGFPLSATAAFTTLIRPTAAGDSDVVWRGLVDTNDSGFADASGLFRRTAIGDGAVEALYVSADVVDGVELSASSSAVNSDFSISDDGAHILAQFSATGSSQTDSLVVLDDTIVAREGDTVPSFPAETWGSFDLSSVNDGGNYVFTGDSSAATNADEFVAYNGDIVFHEGDVIDGINVTFDVRFVAINDSDNVAIGWASNSAGIAEHVFFACRGAELAADVQLLLSTNDEIDLDGDTVGDVTVEDLVIATNDPGRLLGDSDAVFVEVDLDPGDLNAIVRIPFDCCGDGNVGGGETCDDANDDDNDECPGTCQTAACGDGFVHAGVEECDDGNNDDDDGCDASCVIEEPVPGSTGPATSTGRTGTGSTSGPSATTSSSAGSDSTGLDESGTAGGATTTTTSGSTGGSPSPSSEGTTDDDTDADGDTSTDEGCSCSSGSGEERTPAVLWALVLAGGLVARRRRSR